MIITGTTFHSSRTALDLAHHYKEPCQLFTTAGTHPHYSKDCNAECIANTRKLLEDPLCVAVGETGLDFNRNYSPPDVQEAIFDAHLSLAAECGKPLFCHERDAHARFLSVLDRHPEIEGSRSVPTSDSHAVSSHRIKFGVNSAKATALFMCADQCSRDLGCKAWDFAP
jgi:Tat protein secretion system quality control protein TatD with DNase activity